MREPSTGSPFLPTPSKMRAAPTPTFSAIADSRGRMYDAAGFWTFYWARSDAMTEEEWLACTDPEKMLEFLRGKASDRKLRLFAVACCRRVWHLLLDNRSRKAVEAAERYADAEASREELLAAKSDAKKVTGKRVTGIRDQSPQFAAVLTLSICSSGPWLLFVAGNAACLTEDKQKPDPQEQQRQCELLRDIFGNPFQPVTPDPACLTSTVKQPAEVIYTGRAFDRLPVLADALEEAGCTDAAILGHCRGGGEHVRGCWVVDLLLGNQ